MNRHRNQNPATPSTSERLRAILSKPSARLGNVYDIWNSGSAGHQVGDGASTPGAAGWNEVRQMKIAGQLVDEAGIGGCGVGGGKRKRVVGERDIRDYFGVGKKVRVGGGSEGYGDDDTRVLRCRDTMDDGNVPTMTRNTKADATTHARVQLKEGEEKEEEDISTPSTQLPESKWDSCSKPNSSLFASLTFYVNGSTAPRISDHTLKRLLVAHGARLSISMARRSVTHVILGNPNHNRGDNKETNACDMTGGGNEERIRSTGSGGGLAAGKLQHEIRLVRGEGVKYVGVEWVLECIKAGRRIPESRFANLHMAPPGQKSVLEHFASGSG